MSTPPPPQQSHDPYGEAPAAPQGVPAGPPYPAAWPPPPPSRRRRTGLVLGIVGGAVALAIAGVAAFVVVRVNSDAGYPAAEYRLTLPQKLLDGEYELEADYSDASDGAFARRAERTWDARDVEAAVATYTPVDRGGQLSITGLYGRFKDADGARDGMLKDAGEAEGTEVAVPPREFRPSGSDVTVTCQVVARRDIGVRTLYPLCGWNDGNTGAMVLVVDPALTSREPGEMDLEGFAEQTLRIRADLRRPIG